MFLSHSPFTWLVEGADFLYDEKLTRGSYAFDRSLDEWMRSVDPDKRELFMNTMYELFTSTEATTWSQFQDNLARNIATVFQRGRSLDVETRSFLLRTLASGAGDPHFLDGAQHAAGWHPREGEESCTRGA